MRELLTDYERVEIPKVKALTPGVIILNGDEAQKVKREFLNLDQWRDLPAAQSKRGQGYALEINLSPSFPYCGCC